MITKEYFEDKKLIDFITDETKFYGINKEEDSIEEDFENINNHGIMVDSYLGYFIVFCGDYTLIFKGDKCIGLVYCYECDEVIIERNLLILTGFEMISLLWLDNFEYKRIDIR